MRSRIVLTIVLALVLMALVMGTAAALTFTGAANRDKWAFAEGWSQPAAAVSSLKVTNLNSTAKTDLFVQAGNAVEVYDAAGSFALDHEFPGTLATTLGDVDGDGRQEIIAFYQAPEGGMVAALRAAGGRAVWQTALAGLGQVGRAAAFDLGTGRAGVVVGDTQGRLVALSEAGAERWRYELPSATELRGLDDVVVDGKVHLIAAADRGGQVVVLDSQGQVAWRYSLAGGLRRLRTYELTGPGQSAVLLGGEDGTLCALSGGSGQVLWTAALGQAITEIRLAELDGNPSTREVVAGGKKGGVWGLSQAGQQLFAASVGGAKVMEIASLDAEGTGRDMVAVGDEAGAVTFFDAGGRRLAQQAYAAPINRLATAKLAGREQFLVADATHLRALLPTRQTAPFWYTPLLAGLLACLVIAAVAFVVGSMKPAPVLQLSAEQMTVEAQKARRLMLHEAIADLRRLKEAGEVPPEAYLARLKDLRGQLADAEANLIRLGVPLQAETFKCPHCGGALQLGADRCEYCGQVVIM